MSNEARNEPLYDPVPPTDYECHDFDANPLDERNRRLHDEKDNGNSHYNPSGDDRIPYNKVRQLFTLLVFLFLQSDNFLLMMIKKKKISH